MTKIQNDKNTKGQKQKLTKIENDQNKDDQNKKIRKQKTI